MQFSLSESCVYVPQTSTLPINFFFFFNPKTHLLAFPLFYLLDAF